MATLSGSSQTNSAGNRTWRVSLDYTLSNSETTTTLSTSLYAQLITNGSWTNVYFTTRGVSSTSYTIYSASTQITLNWSGSGRNLITTPSTKPTYNRECTDQVKTVSASLKHKESGKTSSGSANFTVPHRTLYTVTYNANGGTLGANTVTSCTHCGGNHKSYGYNVGIDRARILQYDVESESRITRVYFCESSSTSKCTININSATRRTKHFDLRVLSSSVYDTGSNYNRKYYLDDLSGTSFRFFIYTVKGHSITVLATDSSNRVSNSYSTTAQ